MSVVRSDGTFDESSLVGTDSFENVKAVVNGQEFLSAVSANGLASHKWLEKQENSDFAALIGGLEGTLVALEGGNPQLNVAIGDYDSTEQPYCPWNGIGLTEKHVQFDWHAVDSAFMTGVSGVPTISGSTVSNSTTITNSPPQAGWRVRPPPVSQMGALGEFQAVAEQEDGNWIIGDLNATQSASASGHQVVDFKTSVDWATLDSQNVYVEIGMINADGSRACNIVHTHKKAAGPVTFISSQLKADTGCSFLVVRMSHDGTIAVPVGAVSATLLGWRYVMTSYSMDPDALVTFSAAARKFMPVDPSRKYSEMYETNHHDFGYPFDVHNAWNTRADDAQAGLTALLAMNASLDDPLSVALERINVTIEDIRFMDAWLSKPALHGKIEAVWRILRNAMYAMLDSLKHSQDHEKVRSALASY
jgi:hypothetical protein